MIRQKIFVGIGMLVLCAGTGTAQGWEAFISDPGATDPDQPLLLDMLNVTVGEPFTVYVNAWNLWVPGCLGYSLDFSPTSAYLAFANYVPCDPHALVVSNYPKVEVGPSILWPTSYGRRLGSATFTAGALGGHPLFLDPSGTYMEGYGYAASCFPAWVYASPTAAPAPPGYDMGVVANGNFEANGGGLANWSAGTGGQAIVGVNTLGTDHTAYLSTTGTWTEEWVPGEPPDGDGWEEYYYESGWAEIYQDVVVPLNATELTFVYYSSASGDDACARVGLGNASAILPEAGNWTTYSLPVDEADRGQTVTLWFSATDNSANMDCNTIDLYLDYVGLVPEPATLSLLVLGGLGLIARRRRCR